MRTLSSKQFVSGTRFRRRPSKKKKKKDESALPGADRNTIEKAGPVLACMNSR